jgi:hypothetical protein
MAKLFGSVLIILVLPAIITIINVLQDYADGHLSLNSLEQIVMDAWPFALIGLFILGIFKIIGRFNNKD